MRNPRMTKREEERGLPDHVEPIPERAMRHFVAIGIAHRLRQRAAGADPAAIGAFPPAKDDERNDDEGLDRNEIPSQSHIGCSVKTL